VLKEAQLDIVSKADCLNISKKFFSKYWNPSGGAFCAGGNGRLHFQSEIYCVVRVQGIGNFYYMLL
jgi:hypothetical protein